MSELIFVPEFELLLETGGALLLETGGPILLESSAEEHAVVVVDDNPVFPVPHRYQHTSVFFQGEPNDQVNPVYYEAWQNPSTQLMPIYPVNHLKGLYESGMSGGSWEVLQLSTPVFDINGIAVSAPTGVDLITDGAGDVEQKGPTT